MFNRFISRLIQRMKREFQENIRPVVDRSVREAFERHRTLSQGVTGNNPVHSQNPSQLANFNEFLGRYQYIVQGAIGSISIGLGAYGLYLAELSYNAQIESNELSRAQLSSNERLTEAFDRLSVVSEAQLESQRELRDAIDRAIEHSSRNSARNNNGIVRVIADVVHIIRGLIDISRFFRNNADESSDANGENVSGHRDPSDESFSTPPSGKAYKDRKRENDN